LLRSRGHEVDYYQQSNLDINDMSKGDAAKATLWSTTTSAEMTKRCEAFRPDIIHAHNTFPLISPSLYWVAAKRRIPMVQTLHNFRLLCPQAMFLRNGKACEDCLGRAPWRAVARGCYRDSVLQTGVVSSMLMLHRTIGSYRNKVTSYIALSNFSREKFVAGGLPGERIHVKPNFVESKAAPQWHENGRRGGLFVGRLSSEKGLDVLIGAMQALQCAGVRPRVRIVGSGPLEASVREAFQDDFLGPRASAEVFDLLHTALFVVAPSTCYETFGLVAVEAFACGTPVIASRHGGLGELVEDGVTGLLFDPGDADDLARKIGWAIRHPEEMLRMGRAAHAEYLKKYTPQENYRMLTDIYHHAIAATQGGHHAN
jgi:glycosyltransferase involved in cell wall biosynthesis